MTVIIHLYDKINLNKIRFEDTPYKKTRVFYKKDSPTDALYKSVYYIDVTYRGSGLYVQIPRLKISSINVHNRKVVLHATSDFYTRFLKKIDEYVIANAYDKSRVWFYGKHFTLNKIQNGFVSAYDRETGLLTLQIGHSCKWFDQYKNVIDYNNLKEDVKNGSELVGIIEIPHLQFIDNCFCYNVVLQQAKIYVQPELHEYAICDVLGTTETEIED